MDKLLDVLVPRRLLVVSFACAIVVAIIAWLLIEVVPPTSMTAGTMHMMKRRMLRFAHTHGSLPTSSAQLPVIDGFSDRVNDGWGKPIIIRIDGDDVTLTSYGRDGIPGGDGEDADMVAVFRAKDANGVWANEFCEWQIDPFGRRNFK